MALAFERSRLEYARISRTEVACQQRLWLRADTDEGFCVNLRQYADDDGDKELRYAILRGGVHRPIHGICGFGSTVKEDVDDEAATILEDRVCADAPRHESAEAFASSFRVENFGVAQKAADDGMLITEPLAVRRDEWSL